MKIKIIIAIISVLGIGCAPVKTTITINESRIFDDLIIMIKKEANEIGGSFRSPGIESRVAKLIKAKLQKARLYFE